MEEIWKRIEGTDREYAISNYGRVKSFNYKGHKGIERIIKGSTDKHGYLFCMFFTNGKPKRYSISREVAKHLYPTPRISHAWIISMAILKTMLLQISDGVLMLKITGFLLPSSVENLPPER